MNRQGMTLLEVLISLTILAFMGVFLADSLQTAVRNKQRIQSVIERETMVHDALAIMVGDIRRAFHHYDVAEAAHQEALREWCERRRNPGPTPNPTPNPGSDPTVPPPPAPTPGATPTLPAFCNAAPTPSPPNFTQFRGTKERLDFTSLAGVRLVENAPVSDQAEVGYYQAPCSGRIDKRQNSQCLWRRFSPVLDKDVTEGGTAQVLLENLTKFELRYLGSGQTKWVDVWSSDDSQNSDTKGKFPSAVEISIEYHNQNEKNNKPFSFVRVAEIQFPNNPDEKKTNPPPTPQPPGIPTPPGGGQ